MTSKVLIAILLGYALSSCATASSVVYAKVKACGVSAHVVTVNLADSETRVTVALARGGYGKSESFKSMVGRIRPSAAITGTFFDTRSYIPTGDIAVFGKVVHTGCIGSALCIDSQNRASIVPLREGRKQGWERYETVLCCGPRLVSGGAVDVRLQHEGFSGSLYASATRTAVGITKAGKLVLVAINKKTSLHRIAKLMVAIGVRDALCLDGGSSTGFYANGAYKASPPRRLTNLLVVYSKSGAYEKAKTALVPASMLPKPVEAKPALTALAELTAAAMPVADSLFVQPGAPSR